jgi:hypothetical protein
VGIHGWVGKMVGGTVGQSDVVVWRQQGGGGAVARTWALKFVCQVGSGPGGPWAIQAEVASGLRPFQFWDGPTLFRTGWPT